jgi:hypothetical protein
MGLVIKWEKKEKTEDEETKKESKLKNGLKKVAKVIGTGAIVGGAFLCGREFGGKEASKVEETDPDDDQEIGTDD